MANEASVVIVARMRDEASAKLKGMGSQLQATQQQTFQFNLMMTTLGSTMSAMGGLLGQMDSPLAKTAQKFLMIGAAAMLTISSVTQLIAILPGLIRWLRNLAIAQAFVQALSGIGIGTVIAGRAGAGAAAVGIHAATGGFSRGGAGTTNVTITGPVMGNEQEARQFAHAIQRFMREDARVGR